MEKIIKKSALWILVVALVVTMMPMLPSVTNEVNADTDGLKPEISNLLITSETESVDNLDSIGYKWDKDNKEITINGLNIVCNSNSAYALDLPAASTIKVEGINSLTHKISMAAVIHGTVSLNFIGNGTLNVFGDTFNSWPSIPITFDGPTVNISTGGSSFNSNTTAVVLKSGNLTVTSAKSSPITSAFTMEGGSLTLTAAADKVPFTKAVNLPASYIYTTTENGGYINGATTPYVSDASQNYVNIKADKYEWNDATKELEVNTPDGPSEAAQFEDGKIINECESVIVNSPIGLNGLAFDNWKNVKSLYVRGTSFITFGVAAFTNMTGLKTVTLPEKCISQIYDNNMFKGSNSITSYTINGEKNTYKYTTESNPINTAEPTFTITEYNKLTMFAPDKNNAGNSFVKWTSNNGGEFADATSKSTKYTIGLNPETKLVASYVDSSYVDDSINAPAKGTVFSSGLYSYKITDAKTNGAGTIALRGFTKGKSTTTVKIANTVKYNGITYKITSISKNAFKKNKKIKSVKIGNNVKTIGANAFYKVKKLKKVTIGKNVTKIGKHAFCQDTKLRTITINSKKIKSVGKHSLYKTKNLKIKVPKSKVKKYKKLFKNKGQKKNAKVRVVKK